MLTFKMILCSIFSTELSIAIFALKCFMLSFRSTSICGRRSDFLFYSLTTFLALSAYSVNDLVFNMFILIVITSLAIVHIFSHDCFFYGYIDDDWKSITTYFALNDFMLSLTTFSAHNTSLRNDEPFWCPLIRKRGK